MSTSLWVFISIVCISWVCITVTLCVLAGCVLALCVLAVGYVLCVVVVLINEDHNSEVIKQSLVQARNWIQTDRVSCVQLLLLLQILLSHSSEWGY